MQKYTVIAEAGLELDGQVIAKGTVVELDPTDEFTLVSFDLGKIELAPEETKLEAEAEVAIAPGVGTAEPRLRYRGKLVVADGERTVGAQTFKHIRLEDGSEQDLTDQEYATEVKLSYPPNA